MESQEQREEKQGAGKLTAVVVAVLVIAGAAIAAYKTGIIPGFGEGANLAQQLKTNTEALKGGNIQTRLVQYFESEKLNAQLTDEQRKKLKTDIDQMLASGSLSFDYSDIRTSSGDGKGTIEIMAPKLVLAGTGGDKSAEMTAPKLVISEKVMDKNDYFFHSEGDLELYTTASGGTKNKLLAISAEAPVNEIRFDDNGRITFSKSSAKNVKFIEGRGNTVVLTVGDVNTEIGQTMQGNKVDAYARINYNNIAPGDMIKMMLGAIEPIAINLDYTYKGDNLGDYFSQMMKSQQPGAAPAPAKPFDGSLKLNNFSIMMGNAGLGANADLQFKKENAKSIPYGVINFKIAQYQKLIDYFNKFARLPQEQVDNSIKFLSEIGTNAGGNITISVKLDGTDNALIGGKTVEQVKAIEQKYYPAMPAAPAATPAITSPDSVQAAPPAPVTGTPIVENGAKI